MTDPVQDQSGAEAVLNLDQHDRQAVTMQIHGGRTLPALDLAGDNVWLTQCRLSRLRVRHPIVEMLVAKPNTWMRGEYLWAAVLVLRMLGLPGSTPLRFAGTPYAFICPDLSQPGTWLLDVIMEPELAEQVRPALQRVSKIQGTWRADFTDGGLRITTSSWLWIGPTQFFHEMVERLERAHEDLASLPS